DGLGVEEARLDPLEERDVRPERRAPQRGGAGERAPRQLAEHVAERPGELLPLALAGQLGDAPRVARLEAVRDPVVRLAAGAAALEPRARMGDGDHAATVGRRRSTPAQASRPLP